MDALWADTPSALAFFIAGAGQGGDASWGSGFTTDKALIAVNEYSGAPGQRLGFGGRGRHSRVVGVSVCVSQQACVRSGL